MRGRHLDRGSTRVGTFWASGLRRRGGAARPAGASAPRGSGPATRPRLQDYRGPGRSDWRTAMDAAIAVEVRIAADGRPDGPRRRPRQASAPGASRAGVPGCTSSRRSTALAASPRVRGHQDPPRALVLQGPDQAFHDSDVPVLPDCTETLANPTAAAPASEAGRDGLAALIRDQVRGGHPRVADDAFEERADLGGQSKPAINLHLKTGH